MKKEITRLLASLLCFTVLLSVLLGACKKDDYEGELTGVCPVVVSTDPMDKAVDVALDKVISVTFNTEMDSNSINAQTFSLKQGTTVISGKWATTVDPKVFTFKPAVALTPFAVYSGTITTGAKDRFQSAMVADYSWSFTAIPQVTITSLPIAGGTTTGAGTSAQGSSVAVSAVPNAGFTFTSWTESGKVVSTSPNYLFIMAGNRALVANFTAIPVGSFAVNLSSAPVAGGITTGSGSYVTGTTIAITAVANPGFTFVNWTENGTVASTSSSFQIVVASNRTLVANFRAVPATQFSVILSSSPAAGGTTDGEGAYASGTSVTITSARSTGYTFVNWTDKVTGLVVSTSPAYTFVLSANRTFVANFILNTYTLATLAVNGSVLRTPDQATYNHGTSVTLTAVPSAGYVFTGWTGDASGSTSPLTVVMNSNKVITANFILISSVGIGPGPINLGTAGTFAILSKASITTIGVTSITGDIGVSPAAATAMTGFGLIMDANLQSSHTPIVVGKVYAADYAAPTPTKMSTAVSDMETAFTTANNLITPAPIVGLYNGDISGRVLPAGLYKWATGVLITNAGVTLTGGPNDTWVFQIAQDLTINDDAIIHLQGGAQAKNVFFVVTGQATLGTNTDFSGIILSKTLISLKAGSKVNGRLLAQTAVTMNATTVVVPN
ncbi:ice-binding family protein [Pedobacter sp. PWIIR3]